MYKVFVNDYPIILAEKKNISTKYKKVNFEEAHILKEVETLFNGDNEGICLLCCDLERSWDSFKSNFKEQKAAGGKVINLKKEVLFIYRLNKWDLPKGKMENDESFKECALREVEEECGISNLEIHHPLETTYHIFKREEQLILKVTHWFLMSSNFLGRLVPQSEEAIEIAVFKGEKEIDEALKNTYENIKLLFKTL